ncbi:hypothetical protein PM082_004503 [Marasmius tenuissimus]|nr:hypothetical protein PM082_004503 [Marasmius tenuissimus]
MRLTFGRGDDNDGVIVRSQTHPRHPAHLVHQSSQTAKFKYVTASNPSSSGGYVPVPKEYLPFAVLILRSDRSTYPLSPTVWSRHLKEIWTNWVRHRGVEFERNLVGAEVNERRIGGMA